MSALFAGAASKGSAAQLEMLLKVDCMTVQPSSLSEALSLCKEPSLAAQTNLLVLQFFLQILSFTKRASCFCGAREPVWD